MMFAGRRTLPIMPIEFIVLALTVGLLTAAIYRRNRAFKRMGLSAAAQIESEALEVALHLAAHEANRRQRTVIDLPLLAWACLQDEQVQDTLRMCNAEVSALEDALEEMVQAEGVAAVNTSTKLAYSPAAEYCIGIALAIANQCEEELDGPTALVRTLLFSHDELACTSLAQKLEALQVDVRPLVFVLAHGSPESPPPVEEPNERYELTLHNDAFTTMEFVQTALEDHFDLPAADARALMLRVHLEGSASTGVFGAQRALVIAQSVQQEARALFFPLRISLQPVQSPS